MLEMFYPQELDKILEDTYNEVNFGWDSGTTETTVVEKMKEKLNRHKDQGGHPKVLRSENVKKNERNLIKIKKLVEKKKSEYDKKKKEEDNIGFCKTAFNDIKAQDISATEKQKKLEHTRCAEVPDLYKKYSDELQVQVDQEQKQMEEDFTKAKRVLELNIARAMDTVTWEEELSKLKASKVDQRKKLKKAGFDLEEFEQRWVILVVKRSQKCEQNPNL